MMKSLFVKISSLFFLVVLLCSNVTNLHVYFHEHETSDCQNYENGNENEESTPCDICLLAFNLNNLDYNNSLEFSYEIATITKQPTQKEVLSYSNLLHKTLYLNKNRNKAPPTLL